MSEQSYVYEVTVSYSKRDVCGTDHVSTANILASGGLDAVAQLKSMCLLQHKVAEFDHFDAIGLRLVCQVRLR